MTAATLTFTEFLLARIAEDETEVTRLVAHYPHSADEQGWYGNMDDVDVRVGLGRALAECSAKRAIVEEATGQHTGSAEGYDIVRILAAIYADHADYDESWRP